MIEYLIRRSDDDWFDLKFDQFPDALKPISFASEQIDGSAEFCIRTEGVDIKINYEDPGFHIVIEGDVPGALADQIVDEIRQNVERVTGQPGHVVPL